MQNNPHDGTVHDDTFAAPHDLDVERAVLGHLLTHTQAADDILAELSPADFFRHAHQLVFRAMQELHGRGEATGT